MIVKKEKYPSTSWEIDWYVCKMDAQDVEFAKSEGDLDAKEGREMWRVARSIGPISIEHDHWAGHHLGCSEAEAKLTSVAPKLLKAAIEADECLQALEDVGKIKWSITLAAKDLREAIAETKKEFLK